MPLPVLGHGVAGSADSFSAADPSVLKDGSVWKMWYTGDDSNKKRIAYATSTDGMTWAKGGKVIAPEDPGVSANIQFGAFAPTVWKTASGFSMLLTGRKLVGGGVFQTKIMETTSTDGLVWAGPSPALNPSGTNTNFDFSNLNSPDLLYDPGTSSVYKLYYSGNTIDANGNFHTRIGLATSSNGTSFNKFNGSQTGGSVFDVGPAGVAFDARQASGVSAAAPAGGNPKFVGFYWGTRGSDFKPGSAKPPRPTGAPGRRSPAAPTAARCWPCRTQTSSTRAASATRASSTTPAPTTSTSLRSTPVGPSRSASPRHRRLGERSSPTTRAGQTRRHRCSPPASTVPRSAIRR